MRAVAVVAAGDGFSASARQRIERAIAEAEAVGGVSFTVNVGSADGDTRVHAQKLLAGAHAYGPHVVVFVSPGQRRTEVVTNAAARSLITDEAAALAVLSMTTSFSVGDLTGGIVTGVRMLGEAAHALAV